MWMSFGSTLSNQLIGWKLNMSTTVWSEYFFGVLLVYVNIRKGKTRQPSENLTDADAMQIIWQTPSREPSPPN